MPAGAGSRPRRHAGPETDSAPAQPSLAAASVPSTSRLPQDERACGHAGCETVEVSRLVPELICSDLAPSLCFYQLLGFEVAYERPRERIAYLKRDGADLMLEQPLIRDPGARKGRLTGL